MEDGGADSQYLQSVVIGVFYLCIRVYVYYMFMCVYVYIYIYLIYIYT